MSDLQIGLLAIGAAIVVGVLLFNWLQERRFRKQADAAFESPVGDALMQSGTVPRSMHSRVEPGLQEPVLDAGGVSEVAGISEPHLHIDTGASLAEAQAAHREGESIVTRPAAESASSSVPRAQPASLWWRSRSLRRVDRIPNPYRQ